MTNLSPGDQAALEKTGLAMEAAAQAAMASIQEIVARFNTLQIPPHPDAATGQFRGALLTMLKTLLNSTLQLMGACDVYSAGMLVRKVYELVFCLAAVEKRGRDGLERISQIAQRDYVSSLQELMGNLGQLDYDHDKSAMSAKIKDVRGSLPNGDISRLGAEKIASLAGMDSIYEKAYASLHPCAHFHMPHLVELAVDNSLSRNAWRKRFALVVHELQRAMLLATRDGLPSLVVGRDELVASETRAFSELEIVLIAQMNISGRILGTMAGFIKNTHQR